MKLEKIKRLLQLENPSRTIAVYSLIVALADGEEDNAIVITAESLGKLLNIHTNTIFALISELVEFNLLKIELTRIPTPNGIRKSKPGRKLIVL